MEIKKSWFYHSCKISSKHLVIWEWVNVTIFDDSQNLEKILVWKNSKLNYFLYIEKLELWNLDNFFKKYLITSGENSEVFISGLIFSRDGNLKINIVWEICSNNSKIDANVVCIASGKAYIDLDWQIQINKSLKGIEGYLVEDNVFLWDNAKIRGLPTLLVRSDDVKASHACRVEKISDANLFYLRSRWIWRDNALSIILESYFVKVFWNLKEIDSAFYENFSKKVLGELVNNN